MKSNVILVLLLAILALLLTGAWLVISERTKKRVMYYVPDAVFSEAGMEEPNHQIYVWLWVPEKRPKTMYDVEPVPHYFNTRNAQPRLIRSPLVLGVALQMLETAQLDCLKNEEDKVGWLAKRLDVRFLDDSEILQITIQGGNPEEQVKILQAVRTAYMDQITVMDSGMERRQRQMLENAYKNMEKQIARKRIQYKNLWEQLTMPDSMSSSYAFGINTTPLQQTMDSLRNRRDTLQEEIFGLDRQIAILQGRLSLLTKEEETGNEKSSDAQLPLPIDAEKLQAEMKIAVSDRQALQSMLDVTMKAYKQEVAKAEQASRVSPELDNLREEIDRMKKMYHEIGRQLDEWKIEEQMGSRVVPMNEPWVPKHQ